MALKKKALVKKRKPRVSQAQKDLCSALGQYLEKGRVVVLDHTANKDLPKKVNYITITPKGQIAVCIGELSKA